MAAYDALLLHITSDKFYLEPAKEGVGELLTIDRVSQEINLKAKNEQLPTSAISKQVYGIFGIIRLTAGPYLVVITKRSKVGEINGHTIWKVEETELHSYKRTFLHLTEKQMADNRVYYAMVKLALQMETYYYSSTYDITHTMQRLNNTSPDFHSMSLLERCDPRFTWNGHMLRELAQQPELSSYCLPVILGFVSIQRCNINGKAFDYILVSRRCVYRAGTRFNVRGIDEEGQVANYVETEQIVQHEDHTCSFVQTRGSIPVFWAQRANIRYKPKIVMDANLKVEVFQRHLEDQIFNYGEQVLINLVNSSGSEGQLEKAFSQCITTLQNLKIRYEYFDFHHECRKMRWDRLSILMDRLKEDIIRFGYFMCSKDGSTLSEQRGVFRTNCIDCLDRTNVVQGLIAKEVLKAQLQERMADIIFEDFIMGVFATLSTRLGILNERQNTDDIPAFKNIYNNIWADNADYISKQYAGTGALKTDFTRLGKRTQRGLLMDGWNSLIRYFKNNFGDGFRQDSIDLVLGNYVVDENEGVTKPSPLQKERDWKFYAIPVMLAISFAMCAISILIPDEDWTIQFMSVLFWGSFMIISLVTIFIYGAAFIDKPRLVHAH